MLDTPPPRLDPLALLTPVPALPALPAVPAVQNLVKELVADDWKEQDRKKLRAVRGPGSAPFPDTACILGYSGRAQGENQASAACAPNMPR